MRRNDILVPLSVLVMGLGMLSGVLQIFDRVAALEGRLVRLEVLVQHRLLDRQKETR